MKDGSGKNKTFPGDAAAMRHRIEDGEFSCSEEREEALSIYDHYILCNIDPRRAFQFAYSRAQRDVVAGLKVSSV